VLWYLVLLVSQSNVFGTEGLLTEGPTVQQPEEALNLVKVGLGRDRAQIFLVFGHSDLTIAQIVQDE